MAQNARKTFSGRGSAPDPAGGAYSAPRDPVAGGEGYSLPILQLPHALGPSDVASPVPHSKIVPLSAPHLIQAGDAPESHISYD